MADGVDVVTVINAHVQKLGYLSPKKEQEDVIVGFLSGRDFSWFYRLDLGKHCVMHVFCWFLMAYVHYMMAYLLLY